jgi:hypothetical protein
VEQLEAPTKQEVDNVRDWFSQNESSLPIEVRDSLRRVLAVYLGLAQSAKRAKATLETLRRAMGFSPKSERGALAKVTAQSQEPSPALDLNDPAFADLKRKRDELRLRPFEWFGNLTAKKMVDYRWTILGKKRPFGCFTYLRNYLILLTFKLVAGAGFEPTTFGL